MEKINDNTIDLRIGNCIDVMKELEDNSIDSIVTDPPYGINFMGKKWDYDVPSVEIWKECLRVLKPGGYLLAFAGTRTQHRMACNIEDAGFEIRDMVAWIYGSGFPKSLNIGKAIDKLEGNEREVIDELKTNSGGFAHINVTNEEHGFRPDAYNGNANDDTAKNVIQTTKGNSIGEGWGTALKPALEPITVARKPLSEKTVAANVLKWGTGGINIDGCRVEIDPEVDDSRLGGAGTWSTDKAAKNVYAGGYAGIRTGSSVKGRFPANIILDGSDEVTEIFPHSKSGAMKKAYEYKNNGFSMGNPTGQTKQIHESNEGSAARFFYCAKVSKSERNMGCDQLENNKGSEEYRPNDDGKSGIQSRLHGATMKGKNNHPTVKPIKLMEYLVKLVSAVGATVLDPFMGSGTTGIAANTMGCNFIGIEMDENYFEIAQLRINANCGSSKLPFKISKRRVAESKPITKNENIDEFFKF